MKELQKLAIAAALFGASTTTLADSDLLAHIACQAKIASLSEARGLELETGATYVDPTEKHRYRYYVNATDSTDGDAYRATCLVTPRGKILDAALENGQWAYSKRRPGDGSYSREGLAMDNRQ